MRTPIENINTIKLGGYVGSVPEFNHNTYGEDFYTFTIDVPRQSGTEDHLQVMISERLTDLNELKEGEFIELSGNIRTFNKHEGERNHLMIYVFAKDITVHSEVTEQPSKYANDLKVRGFICKAPNRRDTPLGREICDLLVAVNRNFGKADYLPVIVWGRNARFASNLSVGTAIEVTGRLQSREYVKKYSETESQFKTAYELSAARIDVVSEPDESYEKAE